MVQLVDASEHVCLKPLTTYMSPPNCTLLYVGKVTLYCAFETAFRFYHLHDVKYSEAIRTHMTLVKDRSCARADVNHNSQMAFCYEGVGNVPPPFSFHDPPQQGIQKRCWVVKKEVRRDRNDSTDALRECRGPLYIKNSLPYSGVSAVNHGNENYLSQLCQ